jgi:replicative DNA helicase
MSNWEKCVIGTVVNDPAAMQEAGDLLPSDFTGPNVIAWAEVLSLNNRQALGLRALTEALRSAPDFTRHSDIGTPEEYLQDCLNFRGAEIKEYVSQVIDDSVRRAVQRNAALIAAEAQRDHVKADEIIDFAEKAILKLRRNRIDKGVTLGDLLALFMPRLHSLMYGTFKPAWTPEVLAVRQVIHFAEGADYIIVAGRPGDGKSSYMRYEARKHVLHGGRVALINMESDDTEYCRNFLSLETGIDNEKLKTGQGITREELEAISLAAENLARIPLRVKTMGSPSVAEIVRYGRMMAAEENIDLLVVDYVQLCNNGLENKVQDVALTSGQLRGFALNMHVPVMAAAQLSRDIEKRGSEDAKPKLSDLRDSGSLEQDATLILFPRQTWTNPTPEQLRAFPENIDERGQVYTRPKAVPIQFFIEKNRNGATGPTDPVKWCKHTGMYQTLARL